MITWVTLLPPTSQYCLCIARPLILGQGEVPGYEQGCSAVTNTVCHAGTSMVSRIQVEISQWNGRLSALDANLQVWLLGGQSVLKSWVRGLALHGNSIDKWHWERMRLWKENRSQTRERKRQRHNHGAYHRHLHPDLIGTWGTPTAKVSPHSWEQGGQSKSQMWLYGNIALEVKNSHQLPSLLA